MSAAFRSIDPGSAHDIDLQHLPIGDLACLRLLHLADAATAVQLAQLVYGSLRVSQKHLLRLYRSSLLERMAIPDERYGQSEYAYRLSQFGREHLGIAGPLPSTSYLRRTLDTVDTICVLNRTGDRERPAVQLWLTQSMCGNMLTRFLRPDGIALVTTDAGSAVLALETDEGTTQRPGVRATLAIYGRRLSTRPNWQLLVVVPTQLRAEWMMRSAADLDLPARAWVITRSELATGSLDAALQPLVGGQEPRSLRSLLTAPPRWLPEPVGSRAWLEVLAAGGGALPGDALAPYNSVVEVYNAPVARSVEARGDGRSR